MSFSAQSGGPKVSQTLNITSSGAPVNFVATGDTANPDWLAITPQTGSTPSAVTVTADPAGLNPGSYSAHISIFVGSAVTLTVPVSLTVSSIAVSPQLLQFTTVFGSTPQAQILTLSGASTFSASANSAAGWLSIGPSNGSSPTQVFVTPNSGVVNTLAAGSYPGTVTITPATGPPIVLNATLTVTPTPPVSVSPSSINLLFQIGVSNPGPQNLTVSTPASQPLSFTVTSTSDTNPSGSNWITTTPASVTGATGSAQVAVGYNDALNLPAGTYTGRVQVATSGFTPATTSIPVTLLVSNSPLLIVPTTSLNFTYELTGTVPPAQSVTAGSTSGTIPFTATVSSATNSGSWIVVSPASGLTSGTPFSISVNPAGLAPGNYSGAVTLTSGAAFGSVSRQIPVNLTVGNDPLIRANGCAAASAACSLSFPYQIGQTAPLSQNVSLTSSTGGTLNYSVTASAGSCGNWLGLGNASGSTDGTVAVTVLNPSGLSAGTCTGTLSITATNPDTGAATPNSPLSIPVTLIVSANQLLVASPTSVNFSVPVNGQASQTVSLNSTSPTGSISYTVDFSPTGTWLSVNKVSGNTPDTAFQLTAIPGPNLAPGVYTGSVTITASGPGGAKVDNSPVTIPVTLMVSAGTLSVSSKSVSFTQIVGTPASPAQTVQVISNGPVLGFAAAASVKGTVNWLSITPTTGTTNGGSITITADGSKLAAGTYNGTVTVAALGANGAPVAASPQIIQVKLTVVLGTLSVTPAGPLAFSYIVGGAAPATQQLQLTASGPMSFTAVAKTNDNASWLTLTPTSGNAGAAPVVLTIGVNTTGLAANNYSGTITISSPLSPTPVVVNVTLSVSSIPLPTIIGIRNAASGVTGSIAPGENITIYGSGIGPAATAYLQLAAGGKVSTNIGSTQVLFDGVTAAPIIYASDKQTSVMVPYEVAGRATTAITVVYQGVSSAPLTYTLVPTVPGIYTQNFSGSGPGAILNQDYSVNGPNKPAAAGSVVAVYMTGEGTTTPQAITGGVAPVDSTGLNHPLLPVTATVGGLSAKVVYSGSAPGYIYGATQVNIEIPAGLSAGPQPVVISIGSNPTPAGVTVQVQ